MYGCCNCGTDIELNDVGICADCGGFVCSVDCLHEHDCDEEGDLQGGF